MLPLTRTLATPFGPRCSITGMGSCSSYPGQLRFLERAASGDPDPAPTELQLSCNAPVTKDFVLERPIPSASLFLAWSTACIWQAPCLLAAYPTRATLSLKPIRRIKTKKPM